MIDHRNVRNVGKVLRSMEGAAKCTTKLLCCLASPVLFPIVFCFDPDTGEGSGDGDGDGDGDGEDDGDGEGGPDPDPSSYSGGWNVSTIKAPLKAPCVCCASLSVICLPCGQFYIRKYIILDGDMSKYKLWQGRRDGPKFLAKYCPGRGVHVLVPFTIEAGSHGEDKCPNCCLCAEVTCLGCGICSPCACHSFTVNRDIMMEEYNLGMDPLERRFEKCQGFFGELLSCAACSSRHLYYFSCCLRNVAELELELESSESPSAAGGQTGPTSTGPTGPTGRLGPAGEESELSLPLLHISEEANRLRRDCRVVRRICRYGMTSVKVVAIGCMSSQMVHEYRHRHRASLISEPEEETMDRA